MDILNIIYGLTILQIMDWYEKNNELMLNGQSVKGNQRYDLHIYVDNAGNIIEGSEYIPKK